MCEAEERESGCLPSCKGQGGERGHCRTLLEGGYPSKREIFWLFGAYGEGPEQSRQGVIHPARVSVPGVGLPDPGWYLLFFFALSRAPERTDRRLLRAEPRQEEGWGELQEELFGFLMGGFFAWRVLEGDQWGRSPKREVLLCWVKAGAWSL